MPGPGTAFLGGPVLTGTRPDQSDFGTAQLMQRGTLSQNGTAAVSSTFLLPPASVITDITVDTNTVWNSGSTAVLSVGTAAAGTTYASGVDVKGAAARVRPTFTAAQLLALGNVVNNGTVVATITPTGSAATTGLVILTLDYSQTVQLSTGTS